jgi:hypothetical protein
MDNQDSSPQLIFPNVPDDFCPTGTWTDVLQSFIDQVLSNGTINVPGLGDVTPQQIQDLKAEDQDLQNQITATNRRIDDLPTIQKIFRGETGVGASDATYTIALPETLASNNYSVILTPIATEAGTATARVYEVTSSRTTSQFKFIVRAAENVTTLVAWTVIYT